MTYHLYVETKKYNKLLNITKGNRLRDIENQLVITSRQREEGRSNIGVGG